MKQTVENSETFPLNEDIAAPEGTENTHIIDIIDSNTTENSNLTESSAALYNADGDATSTFNQEQCCETVDASTNTEIKTNTKSTQTEADNCYCWTNRKCHFEKRNQIVEGKYWSITANYE